MKTIGIVVAMNRESALLELFKARTEERICGIPFHIFDAKNNKIVLTTCGVGEVSAASATSILICHYGAEEIINYGFVGSLKHDLPINAVVGVNSVIHTDVDLTAFGSKLGQYDGRDEVDFKPSIGLIKNILGENIHLVRLASADKFISDGKKKAAIAKEFSADICDMEGAGIAVVCTRSQIPFAFVKVVVDGLEDDCTQTFEANSIFGVDGAIKKIAEYITK